MNVPFKIGLKLYSTDTPLISEAMALWKKEMYGYIELYIIPGTYHNTINQWRSSGIPFIIHAPHSFHGMNLAVRSLQDSNFERFVETQKFANELNADGIIIHGGHSGSIHETIRQARRLSDSRLLLENKPKVGINDEACIGYSPEDFLLASSSGVFRGFVLDFGHANCAALSMRRETMNLVLGFLAFKPKIFHLSDGDARSEKDAHFNLGKGDLLLEKFLEVIPKNVRVTLEVPRSPVSGLVDFTQDVRFLQKLIGTEQLRERKMILRLATVDDAEILQKWRNDPETRSASLNSEVLLWPEHVRWLEASLKSRTRSIYVAEIENTPIGTIRTDLSDEFCELSWTVAPKVRGKGFGKKMVKMAANQIDGAICSKIRSTNGASQSIAMNAGMSFSFETDGVMHWFREPKSGDREKN